MKQFKNNTTNADMQNYTHTHLEFSTCMAFTLTGSIPWCPCDSNIFEYQKQKTGEDCESWANFGFNSLYGWSDQPFLVRIFSFAFSKHM